MLFTYRVTAGQESIVADLLKEKIKKTKAPISAIVASPQLSGYLIVESNNVIEARKLASDVPHVKGVLRKTMKIEDIRDLLEKKKPQIKLSKGDIVEITSGPFKGERSKIIRIDDKKEEATVELIEVAVPIPVTIKLNSVKALPK